MARQKGGRPTWQSYEGHRIPTQISFDNETSESRTAIEVETEDRLGLLHAISQTFAELELNISAAKIVTEKRAAIDTFYVIEPHGGKISDPRRHAFIARKFRAPPPARSLPRLLKSPPQTTTPGISPSPAAHRAYPNVTGLAGGSVPAPTPAPRAISPAPAAPARLACSGACVLRPTWTFIPR